MIKNRLKRLQSLQIMKIMMGTWKISLKIDKLTRLTFFLV